jgi:Fe-S cluster biogenesis protein NfuA
MAESSGASAPLSGAALEERLARLDGLLDRLDQIPGAMGELALDAVEALTEVYGAALGRVMAHLAATPELAASLAEDELLRHLFALHGLHPQPVTERVLRALEEVRPYIRSHAGDIEFVSLAEGVVRVRLSGTCNGCASSASTLQSVISDAVLGVAPEVTRVEAVTEEAEPTLAFVPLTDLRKPVPR